MDFAKIHRGAAHFGITLEDVADTRGMYDALEVLKEAVDRTEDQDLRHDRQTLEALDFLRDMMGDRLAGARAFQEGLSIQDPTARRHAVKAAYTSLRHAVRG